MRQKVQFQFSFGSALRTKRQLAAFSVLCLSLAISSCFNNGDFYSSSISPLGRSTPTGTPSATSTSTALKSIYISQVVVEGVAPVTPGAQPTPAPSSNSSSSGPRLQVILDSSRSTVPLSDVCSVGQGVNGSAAKPCFCQISWYERNQTTGVVIQVPRLISPGPTLVQPYVAVCSIPADVWSMDIAADQPIKIKLVPAQANSETFDSNEATFTKPTIVSRGSFRDARGRSFSNILRYGCYETNRRGLQIKSKIKKDTTSGGSASTALNLSVPLASQFCIKRESSGGSSAGSAGEGGGGDASDECAGLAPVQNSSQANYFNFYIRESEKGDVIGSNDRYICPKVKEGLLPSTGAANIGQVYPLDSSFALALDRNADFPIGVEAFTKLSNGSDPIAASSSCGASSNSSPSTGSGDNSSSSSGGSSGGSGGGNSAGTRISSCLGFAARVAPDNTCPVYRDEFGNQQPTFRLRRLVAVHPPFYPTDGKLSTGSGGSGARTGAQDVDTIYVIDRPVRMPGDNNPSKPFTMRGPKPCPYSYFDVKGTANGTSAFYPEGMPGYVGTNNPLWNGTNVDGIELPNKDLPSSHPNGPSCSAAMPVYNSVTNVLSIATVNERNPAFKRIYMRPIQAWSPHYEEDLEFQACAPLANPLRDPPLHFARDTASGNIAYCAETYPTQNENIASIDRTQDPTLPPSTANRFVGRVAPFTSHVVKNSSSARCTATLPSTLATIASFYPSATTGSCTYNPSGAGVTGFAYHPSDLWVDQDNNLSSADKSVCSANTCDRTVMSPAYDWPTFPLLGRPNMIESAIAQDSTFGCVITYDGNSSKQGKYTPSEGCCGSNVQMWTGLATSSTTDQRIKNLSAHLEPDVPCLSPKY